MADELILTLNFETPPHADELGEICPMLASLKRLEPLFVERPVNGRRPIPKRVHFARQEPSFHNLFHSRARRDRYRQSSHAERNHARAPWKGRTKRMDNERGLGAK